MPTFKNAHILAGGAFRLGMFAVRDGRIATPTIDADDPIDLGGRLVLPGFVDLQVNGGGGVLFNADPTVAGLARIARAHARHGTTALLPTFVTDDLALLDRAITAVDAAIARGVPGIAGIHIEGPFLAAAQKGAHDATKFLTLAPEHVDRVTALTNGPTLVTVAPERASPAMIAALRERGAVVAIGHSDATAGQAAAAIDAGARGFTHLFNAMSPMAEMAPGCVGTALSDDRAWAGVIADGVHVPPEKLRIAWKCKGERGLVLVTDAMPCVGMAGERVFPWNGEVYRARDGACWNSQGTLSGSDLNMHDAVRNAVRLIGVPLEAAAAMASATPARVMGLDGYGDLNPGCRADFVVTDAALETLETWIGGERVF